MKMYREADRVCVEVSVVEVLELVWWEDEWTGEVWYRVIHEQRVGGRVARYVDKRVWRCPRAAWRVVWEAARVIRRVGRSSVWLG